MLDEDRYNRTYWGCTCGLTFEADTGDYQRHVLRSSRCLSLYTPKGRERLRALLEDDLRKIGVAIMTAEDIGL